MCWLDYEAGGEAVAESEHVVVLRHEHAHKVSYAAGCWVGVGAEADLAAAADAESVAEEQYAHGEHAAYWETRI